MRIIHAALSSMAFALLLPGCTNSQPPASTVVEPGQQSGVFYTQSQPSPPALSQEAVSVVAKAESSALEFGQPNVAYPWTINENHGGTVKASEPFRVGGQDCRRLVYETIVASNSQLSEVTACKSAGESWRAVN